MPDRNPYQSMSEEEMERLIVSLPGAQPPAGLRARVLASSPVLGNRRAAAPRRSLALAALTLLILADVLVLSRAPIHRGTDMTSPAREAAVCFIEDDPELAAFCRALPFLAASGPPALWDASSPDSYFSLRRKLDIGV